MANKHQTNEFGKAYHAALGSGATEDEAFATGIEAANAPMLGAVRVAYEMACSILPIVEGSQGGDGEEVYDYADGICAALRPFLESEGK